MKPDFDTWWCYYLRGAQLLEVEPDTLRIVKGWKHHERPACSKTDPRNDLASALKYFNYCKKQLNGKNGKN